MFELSERHAQVLREQQITDDAPGTVLVDFERLLQFIGHEGLPTTSKFFLLPQSRLNELNERMSRPVTHRLKRPQSQSFPHLHGLFLMLRATGMGLSEGVPPNGRLVLDFDTVMDWRALNATERYFTLLDGWLLQGSLQLVGENDRSGTQAANEFLYLADRLKNRRTVMDRRGGYQTLYSTERLMTAALMELFGWVRLEYAVPEEGTGVQVEAIEWTDFGTAMLDALKEVVLRRILRRSDHTAVSPSGALREFFQPFFPEFQQALKVNPRHAYREGTFVFRVSLPDAWRRISIPDDGTLDELALTILKAFRFDTEHLYCFQIMQSNGRQIEVVCPVESDAQFFTEDFLIGDLPVAEGGLMTMIYDYGDCWEFKIKLEEIRPAGAAKRPRVIEKRGKAPAQYEW